jgi:hypothetical protein
MSLSEQEVRPQDVGKQQDTEDVRESSTDTPNDVESGDEPSVAEIERIYRWVLPTSVS